MKIKYWVLFTSLLFAFTSCAVKKQIPSASQTIANQINSSAINQQHQVGFVVREIGATQNMFEQNAERYFTPASNTKLFTFILLFYNNY